MYTYSKILSKALKTGWQNPGLWFFGFWTVFLGGIGLPELIFSRQLDSGNIFFKFLPGLFSGQLFTLITLKSFFRALSTNPVSFFIIILIFLIILGWLVLFIWLVIVSQSALIGRAISIVKNRKLSWRESFRLGLNKFWRILSIHVLIRVVIWFLFSLLSILALLKFRGAAVVFVLGFIIFSALLLLSLFVFRYTVCGIVLKDWRIFSGVKAGGRLFLENWLLSIELSIILFLVNFLVSGTSFFMFYFLFIYLSKLLADVWAVLLIVYLLLFCSVIAVQIFLAIFYWVTWGIVFEILTLKKSPVPGFLERGFRKIKG